MSILPPALRLNDEMQCLTLKAPSKIVATFIVVVFFSERK